MSLRTKRITLGVSSLLALAAGWYGITALSRPVEVPPAFVEGRREAATLAERIVGLTSEVNRTVALVGSAEQAGEHAEALVFINEAEAKNAEAHREAVALVGKLRTLAETLGGITSPVSQQFALEAVSLQLSLAGEYLAYTSVLGEFFDTLRTSVGAATSDEAIRETLARVNQSAARINEVNRLATEKMREFDESL